MKIVVLTIDHVYANKIAKDLIKTFGDDIKLVVEPKSQLKGKSNLEIFMKYIKVSGIYYTFLQSIKLLVFRLFSRFSKFIVNKNNRFYSYKKLAKEQNVKLTVVDDTNSKLFLTKINKLKPDLIISVLFSQILKKELISIPAKGVINIHPAMLPDYKGISPIFWALLNKEKYTGVTVHFIDEDVDSGPIINQVKIQINNNDTEDTLYWKCVNKGSKILIKSIKQIDENIYKTKINKKGSYFSFPTKAAVSIFRRNGMNFFRAIDLIK